MEESVKLEHNQSLRDHLLHLLRGGNAHISFEDLVKDFPVERCGESINGLPYTPWQVLEHMRIAQWDILEFSRSAEHVSPEFPKGYWPSTEEAGTPELWAATVANYRADLLAMEQLVSDPGSQLFDNIPHGDGQTLLREALLVADHNSYHLGVLTVMGRLLRG
jgi:hypothetical protein